MIKEKLKGTLYCRVKLTILKGIQIDGRKHSQLGFYFRQTFHFGMRYLSHLDDII